MGAFTFGEARYHTEALVEKTPPGTPEARLRNWVFEIYREGAVNNIAAFHQCIRSGRCDNPTVAASVQSNLITILGRTAAYERRPVTWEEILHSGNVMELRLEGLKT